MISSTCKTEAAESHAELLKLTIDACNDKSSLIQGSIYCLALDGESHQGKALIQLTKCICLLHSSPLYPMLGSLPLLNLLVGECELTSDKDYKHLFKWLCHACLRPLGIMIDGMRITPTMIQSHLEANGGSVAKVNNLMNPTDKQDVPSALNLMKETGLSLTPVLLTPQFHVKFRDVSISSQNCSDTLPCHISMSIWAYMNNFGHSLLWHIWQHFSIHTETLTMHSFSHSCIGIYIQIAVKNAYFCVVKTK